MENLIYCYSGSGNCLHIAKTIARELGNTDIVMMRKAPAILNTTGAKTVGFVFPCYAGGLLGEYEKFVKQLSTRYSTYTYAVVSYAGYPGVGLSRINKIVPLDYWAKISHHCSCIWLFPHQLMLPAMSVDKAQKRSEKLAREVATDVKARKEILEPVPANRLNEIETRLWPKLATLKAKKFTVSDACIGCGQCERLCPKGNITITDGKAQIGKNCIGCLSCLQYCPKEAIAIGQPEKRERYHNPDVVAEELTKDIIHID